MTCLIELTYYRPAEDTELPRRRSYGNPGELEALGLVRPSLSERRQGSYGSEALSRRPPTEYREDSREIEVRDVPDGLTAETVQGFAQECLDRARGLALQGGVGTSATFIEWAYLVDIARLKFVPIPAAPKRPGRGRATA